MVIMLAEILVEQITLAVLHAVPILDFVHHPSGKQGARGVPVVFYNVVQFRPRLIRSGIPGEDSLCVVDSGLFDGAR